MNQNMRIKNNMRKHREAILRKLWLNTDEIQDLRMLGRCE